MEPDGLPHGRPAACVIAHLHSSAIFISLRFQSRKVKTSASFKNVRRSFLVLLYNCCVTMELRKSTSACIINCTCVAVRRGFSSVTQKATMAIAHVQLSSAQLGFHRLTAVSGDTSAAVDTRSDQCELASTTGLKALKRNDTRVLVVAVHSWFRRLSHEITSNKIDYKSRLHTTNSNNPSWAQW
jgi:hypothetical protein